MKRILKYPVEVPTSPASVSTIEMPRGARILSAAVQNRDDLVVWALTDHVQANTETRLVKVLGTGWADDRLDGYDFIGTVLMEAHGLVWHVWAKPSDWEVRP